MPRSFWRRRFILAPASLAFAAGVACAAHAPHNAATGLGHRVKVAHLVGRADCGNGGDGGKGGDSGKGGAPGRPGEPGKPGTHGCTRFEDLPDKPKGKLTLADKVRIVMVVLHGPTTNAEAAKKYKMSAHEIDTWKRQYLAGDWAALMGNDLPS
ncbi:DUF1153 domain-containing protein [Streptomyces sp. NPDC005279]|uniref:DUF1153 domain-containing protein n=1 Tax=Streptomyces sp. NPDC005279 TaxID=3364712 RepID=UPI0036BC7403